MLEIEAEMKRSEYLLDRLIESLVAGPTTVKDFTLTVGLGIVEGLKLIEGSTDHKALLTCYKIETAIYGAILAVLNGQAGKA